MKARLLVTVTWLSAPGFRAAVTAKESGAP
jgi:hypothetical protein